MSRLLLPALAATLALAACGGSDEPRPPAPANAQVEPASAQSAAATATPTTTAAPTATPAARKRRTARRTRSRRSTRTTTSMRSVTSRKGRRRAITAPGGITAAPTTRTTRSAISVGNETAGMVAAGKPMKRRRSQAPAPPEDGMGQVDPQGAKRAPRASQSLKPADLAGLALGTSTLAQVRRRLGKPVSQRSTEAGGRCLVYGAIDPITGKPSKVQRWRLCFDADRILASRATFNV